SRLLNWMGCYLREHARYNEAKPFLERALTINKQAHRVASLAEMTSLSDVAYLSWCQGKYKEAETLLLHAQAIPQERLSYDEPDERLQYAEILQNLACTYQTLGQHEKARQLF